MEVRPSHRRLHQRSIFQPGEPAFWVFVILLAYGALRMVEGLVRLSSISSSGWALSWLLLTIYAVPVFALVYLLDLYEREPLSLAIGAFLWGALAATALSLDASGWSEIFARAFGSAFAARWGPALVAPLVEETMKGAGVVLLYLIARDEMDDMMDGFVYGALCGLAFAVVEDVLYFMAAFGGTPLGVLQGFFVRVISSGLYGHVLYTGLVGMGIGYFVSRRAARSLGRRAAVAAVLIAAGVAGHVLWNSPLLTGLFPAGQLSGGRWLLVPAALAVKGLPLLALVGVAVGLAHRQERRWLDGALAAEVGHDGLTAGELALLRDPRRRRAAVRDMRRRAGNTAAGVLRRLQREQVNLAMLSTKLGARDDPALDSQRAYCASLRDALDAIPGAAPGGDRSGTSQAQDRPEDRSEPAAGPAPPGR